MSFRHEAFFYDNPEAFLTGVLSFVRDGIDRGEPVMVIVDDDKLAALRDALGDEPPEVCFGDMAVVGHNPARIIPAWHDFFDRHAGAGKPLRGIGEPIGPQRAGAELVECLHHEALINMAFPGWPDFWLLCPYSTSLSPDVICGARHNHQWVMEGGECRPSDSFEDVATERETLRDPLPPVPAGAANVAFDATVLTELRGIVAECAAGAGLSEDRQADLVLSVNELAANSIQYGGGSGTLWLWQDDDRLLCEIRDLGVINDPLIGRRAPGLLPESSRGLWVVNQLCDLVQVRSTWSAGTAVRVHMTLR